MFNMAELYLRFPTRADGDKVMAYRQSFIDSNDSMDGTSGLADYDNYDDWLVQIKLFQKKETVPADRVLSDTFLVVRREDDAIIGMVNNRYELNDYLLAFGGHIGYSVKPSERRKGYASQLLHLALDHYRARGIDLVLLTCDKDNIASAKVIQHNGGQLEDERQENNRITQRYWIAVS